MQPFEIATLSLFLFSYLYTAARSIATPEQYRVSEVEFYKTGKQHWLDKAMFGVGAASFLTLMLHFVLESFRVGQLLLYGQVILFIVVLPMHYIDIARKRMSRTLGTKSNANYRASGWKKVAIAAIMIALPLIVKR
jgi:hypothetical protein